MRRRLRQFSSSFIKFHTGAMQNGKSSCQFLETYLEISSSFIQLLVFLFVKLKTRMDFNKTFPLILRALEKAFPSRTWIGFITDLGQKTAKRSKSLKRKLNEILIRLELFGEFWRRKMWRKERFNCKHIYKTKHKTNDFH